MEIIVNKDTYELKLSEDLINELSENIAKQIYYTLLMFKYLPEVRAIEEGKIKGLKNEEIDKFFEELLKEDRRIWI